MVSAEQLEALIGFLENKPELALGRFNCSTEGRSLAKRMWREGANILNSLSSNYAWKEPGGLAYETLKSHINFLGSELFRASQGTLSCWYRLGATVCWNWLADVFESLVTSSRNMADR